MSLVRPRTIVVGLVAGLGFAALVVLGNTGGARPASPPPEAVEVTYEGYWYAPSNKEAVKRLAAGEDPATIPGVTAVSASPGPPEPSAFSSSTDPDEQDSAGTPTPG